MAFPALNRVAELNARFGHLFETFGVKPKIVVEHQLLKIRFEDKARTRFLPVELQFRNEEPRDDWDGVWLVTDEYEEVEIGANDWTWHCFDDEESVEYLTQDTDLAMECIERELTNAKLAYNGAGFGKETWNDNFAMAYPYLTEALCMQEGVEVLCERHEGVEGYEFTSSVGVDWRVAFEPGIASIFMNAEKVATFPPDNPDFLTNYFLGVFTFKENPRQEPKI
ncbi:hypothetical protein DSM25558_5205 [Agrobacterium sp. DSM 25558]|uniref:hypothetical protein n=1 Tax=Agrobacterium sp. DSM 25558 TaxID=1907665 RepID=UPI0009725EA0|nr:hypothetical protein [Agrobacterium sp. DSM 25558]SCX31400.1 hypothetical protein DSM25558_5205 [Agrobacterium sp. DSM 25558]